MARPLSRSVAALAVGTTLLVSGCGSSSSGGSDHADNPKAALVAGVTQLGDADILTTTFRLDASADDLVKIGDATNDPIPQNTADAISSARLVIETTKDKTFSLSAIDGDNTLVELRVIDKTVYVQGDLSAMFDLAGNPDALDTVKAQAAQLPNFVQAFVNGDWVSLDTQALSGLAGQLGATATSSPSADEGPKLLAELRNTIDKDVTVKEVGTDSEGTHLQLSGNTRQLATDFQTAVRDTVPGGGTVADRLDASSAESRTITLDAWVNDGALSKLSLDLAQFDDKNELPQGTSLPIVLTFEQSGHTIDVPTSATPIDLTQLGTLMGAFTGQAG